MWVATPKKYRIFVRNLPLSAEMVKNLKTFGDA